MKQGGIMYTCNQIVALWPGIVPVVNFTSGLKYKITVKCIIVTNTLKPYLLYLLGVSWHMVLVNINEK